MVCTGADRVEQALVTPSQKRASQGEKIRKRIMCEREAKLKYNRPKGEWKRREHPLKGRVKGSKFDIADLEIKSPRGLEPLSRIILLSCNI